MKYRETKYRVSSLAKIQKILKAAGAKKGKKITTTHYYVQQGGNDVVKLVKYKDRNEIHILKESEGKFKLTKNLPVESVKSGLKWLKSKGYKIVNPVKMVYTDYEYKGGIVGLYQLEGNIFSVILDFPEGEGEVVEKEMGLDSAEVTRTPFNKYLRQLGHLRSIKL